ncbi:spore germination protein [Anopheles sinensis]|uniref:Spore germination protein n=1 Tax=Anopheles sinensis TaxID=74873 RepID=A0A084VD97_ANOSI|nr:spore germination protein [Anopheles sinensis]
MEDSQITFHKIASIDQMFNVMCNASRRGITYWKCELVDSDNGLHHSSVVV